MTTELDDIKLFFQSFMQDALIEHDIEKALSVVADDIIGIGMGSQGYVTNKSDVVRIINDGKPTSGENSTVVDYENIQIRCYEDRYATICGILKIKSGANGKTVESTLGQLMNIRKENGVWKIYTLQATPFFNEIEEMEAYPIKFAENILEKYRQQEQMAKNAQNDSDGIYHINISKGLFEDSILKNDLLIRTKKGDPYESIIFEAARRYLIEEERYRFLQLFSIGNILSAYNSGETEISLEYQMIISENEFKWMKTTLKLYTDKADENLKGYLYVFDIDDEKKKELDLKSRAELDPLTDLYNKKYTELKIAEKLKQHPTGNQTAFFMVDLDHFKEINDTYGHREGDRIIKETALCLQSLIGKNGVAGRMGGDEFCMYIQDMQTRETVLEKAEALCQRVRDLLPREGRGCSCSVGIVLCTNVKIPFDEIYQRADHALYLQKEKGRNGYTVSQD